MDSQEITELLEGAARGDRYSLAILYGEASAWMAADKSPPPKLREWLVAVLRDLHAVAWNARQLDPGKGPIREQVFAATRFHRGRRGRPVSRTSALRERALAGDVVHFLTWGWANSLEDAFAKVSEYHKDKHLSSPEPDQVRDAWNRYGKELGKLHRVTK